MHDGIVARQDRADPVAGFHCRLLQDSLGGRWTGVRLLWETPDTVAAGAGSGRVCEMVAERLRSGSAAVLTPETCGCPGVAYALGWRPEAADTIAAELHERLAMDAQDARALLESMPHLQQPPQGLLVGDDGGADVYVSYAQPLVAMNLLRRWHVVHGGTLNVELAAVMAVCSGAVLAAYLSQRPAVTFGCPESRRAGRLSRDRLVLAVPCAWNGVPG